MTGVERATSFTKHLGHDVRFEAVTPQACAQSITPLFGAANAAGVVAVCEGPALMRANQIHTDPRAQTRLGLAPRGVRQWLRDVKA